MDIIICCNCSYRFCCSHCCCCHFCVCREFFFFCICVLEFLMKYFFIMLLPLISHIFIYFHYNICICIFSIFYFSIYYFLCHGKGCAKNRNVHFAHMKEIPYFISTFSIRFVCFHHLFQLCPSRSCLWAAAWRLCICLNFYFSPFRFICRFAYPSGLDPHVLRVSIKDIIMQKMCALILSEMKISKYEDIVWAADGRKSTSIPNTP